MTNAGSSKMSIEDMIGHYQRSIEKSENDPKRLLHCLSKLYRMNVTVQHLQATGIGRTVNALRKDDGDVGVSAKALVSKWKEMVAAEESSECSEDDEDESAEDAEDADETSDNETDRSPQENVANKTLYERRESNSFEMPPIHNDNSHQQQQQQYNYDSNTKCNIEDGNRNSSSQQQQNGHHYSNTVERETSHSRRHRTDDAVPIIRKHSIENVVVNGNDGCGASSNDDILSGNERTDRIENNQSSSHSHNERHQLKHHHTPQENDHVPSKVGNAEREHHTKHSSHKSSSSSNISRDKERNGGNREKTSSKSERSHSDASRKETESSATRKHSDRSKTSSSTTSSNHKRNMENDATASYGDSSGQEYGEMIASKRQKSDTNTSLSGSGSSRRENKKSSKSLKHAQANESFEIDHSMGTSFADALGMIVPTPSTSKGSSGTTSLTNRHSTKMASSTSSHSSSKNHKSTTASSSSVKSSSKCGSSSSSSSNRSRKPDVPSLPPPLLSPKIELPPLEDISVDLPALTITNNYKPMPLNPLIMDCVFRQQNNSGNSSTSTSKPIRMMTDEEALCASISSKTIRTKVYSGVKTGAVLNVPTLHEMCLRVLQKNIDALEYTGGVPFDILRPILERATPEQLYTFEHFNPYLMDDSDVLWKQHCARKFRSKQRQEMETWREMFFRCTTEQEQRLSNLTNNIKLSQSVAVPLKQTKLACIDSMVKPPRNIIKAQKQFGTEHKLVATPAARTTGLNSVAANIARVGDIRLRTSAAMRDTAQVQSSNSGLKARKAPLMAKTLQLMKGRFKR